MFEKLVSFAKKVADLSDRPSLNPADLKAAFDAAPDEVRIYLNKLIDALKKTEAGDSGARNVGATGISGLDGNDVQTILESMKTVMDKKAATAGSEMSGGFRFNSVGDALIIKQAGRKSFVIHRPVNTDSLVITSSVSSDGEDWDWGNAFNFQANGVFLANKGYNNIGKMPAFTWFGTIPVNSFVEVTHNLGYKPIVQFDGNTGNISLTTAHTDVNKTKIYCFSAGGNSWTGTISFY